MVSFFDQNLPAIDKRTVQRQMNTGLLHIIGHPIVTTLTKIRVKVKKWGQRLAHPWIMRHLRLFLAEKLEKFSGFSKNMSQITAIFPYTSCQRGQISLKSHAVTILNGKNSL